MSVSFTKPSINAETAQEVISAAVAKATEKGGAFVIVVVDESGVVKASLRMDGAPLLSIQVAQDKAYTAAGFGMSTDSWDDFIDKDAPLRLGAPTGIDRLVVFGGGYPLIVDGAVIGAVGVSGGHYSDDMEVAGAGVAALAAEAG
jgi:uncharacterized protein GlcG (DUF336 family)